MKTRPDEFEKFHEALITSAPKGYIPWYFPVLRDNKSPDVVAIGKRASGDVTQSRFSWKESWARLNYHEALDRLETGFNVGLAARADDPLCIIDIDRFDFAHLMPDTLMVSSRKKFGFHGFCWWDFSKKINIPTENGEVRASDQYVVAAGSYCTTSENEIKKEKLDPIVQNWVLGHKDLGVYTIANLKPPIFITYEDLPEFFRNRHKLVLNQKTQQKIETIKPNGKHSALFDLTVDNILPILPNRREPHPLHESDTGMNFSKGTGVFHCWRHCVSLNAIQYLVVKSGYMSCLDAGTGHKNSGAGGSKVRGDNGAIFYAWMQAKKDGLIPENDPMPIKALNFVATKYNLIPLNFEGELPVKVYNKVLKIVEEDF